MLREVKNAGWNRRLSIAGWRHDFVVGKCKSSRGIGRRTFDRMAGEQHVSAVPVMTDGGQTWWWCLDRFWVESEALAPADVYALVYERRQRAQRQLQRAHAVVAGRAPAQRQPIPVAIRQEVFERDGGACVQCGATFDLQYDHVIPVAMGGASSAENLQLLCAPCNRAKGASLG